MKLLHCSCAAQFCLCGQSQRFSDNFGKQELAVLLEIIYDGRQRSRRGKWGTGRGVGRLHSKLKHGKSMRRPEVSYSAVMKWGPRNADRPSVSPSSSSQVSL